MSFCQIGDAQIVDETNEVYLVSENAQVMRTDLSEIRSLTGRITQGVTIFKPRPGDSVSSIACVGDFAIDDDEDEKQTSPEKPKRNIMNRNSCW